MSLFSAPFLLGFDAFEESVDRLSKAADSYPPYNIERVTQPDGAESLVISIAVAGFAAEDLEVVFEHNQLVVRGRQAESPARQFLHRGIATRQFQRAFLLADGMEVEGAQMADGLLVLKLLRPKAEKPARRIRIDVGDKD
jgi:HSP20 family molecular chaperone IbpA